VFCGSTRLLHGNSHEMSARPIINIKDASGQIE
jgi:hypothetical protein